jgi:metallo-beta-lactamase family protein
MESTYGDRTHGPTPDYIGNLTEIIQSTLDKGGNVVIPSFAVGRTQELLYFIRHIKQHGLVKGHDHFPVYVDSPLAVEATEIYSSNLREFFDQETLSLLDNGINPIRFPGLTLSVTSEESIAINRDTRPKVILSASGMCEAGRIRHHLKHNLWRGDSTILFVGYQSEGTLGRAILEGAEKVKLFGEEIQICAVIEQLDGISSHADCDMLINWLDSFPNKPKTVFVNHGNDTVCDEFAHTVRQRLAAEAIAPYNGAKYDLISGVCLEEGVTQRILKDPPPHPKHRQSSAYTQLQSALKRLEAVAESYRNGANKDIAKLASQINSICDKWD